MNEEEGIIWKEGIILKEKRKIVWEGMKKQEEE